VLTDAEKLVPAEAYPPGPELVIAFVGPMGVNRDWIRSAFDEALKEVNYECENMIRLTDVFGTINKSPFPDLCRFSTEEQRYANFIDAGNKLREEKGSDALALAALREIREQRTQRTGSLGRMVPSARHAYLLWSFKHPAEVQTLRDIYGSKLIVVGSYSRSDIRCDNIARRIAAEGHWTEYIGRATRLLETDNNEAKNKFGQKVRDTFPLADVFIDASDEQELKKDTSRFVQLLFGHPFHTPTRAEHAMFHARGAALRSASLSRQVGAVITSPDGDLISVGANEVPKAGGGLCWPSDSQGQRDFELASKDPDRLATSDKMVRLGFLDVFKRLSQAGLLSELCPSDKLQELVQKALYEGKPTLLEGTQFRDLIEYGRAVHAEMAAIVDAARRGTPVQGGVLYTTTFPCHDCARHIVAAGIRRVVYIEPYPKSLAPEFHSDSIAVEKQRDFPEQVSFEPFVGVAPSRYLDLFEKPIRKTGEGIVVRWEDKRSAARPRGVDLSTNYLTLELNRFEEFRSKMVANRLW
jgi:deoxycytidylate deaminase